MIRPRFRQGGSWQAQGEQMFLAQQRDSRDATTQELWLSSYDEPEEKAQIIRWRRKPDKDPVWGAI